MAQQPLNDKTPITNADGTPSQYFIRMLQDRGIVLDGKITPGEVNSLINKIRLADLADVSFLGAAPAAGNNLTFDGTTSKWKAAPPSGGGNPVGASFYWNGSAVVTSFMNGVTSVTRNSQGRYRINFTTPFTSLYYIVVGSAKYQPDPADNQIPHIGEDRNGTKALNYCDITVGQAAVANSRWDPGVPPVPGNANVVFFPLG